VRSPTARSWPRKAKAATRSASGRRTSPPSARPPFFSEELPFPSADTLRFRYAVLVADGLSDDNGAAGLAAQVTKALAAG